MHSSWMAVRSCWISAGTGTLFIYTFECRASQTCSVVQWDHMLVMQELVSEDFGGDDGCGGLGCWVLLVLYGCEAGWMYRKIIQNAFGDGLEQRNKRSIHAQQLWGTSLQSACLNFLKLATSVALCCVIKLHILVAFYCGQPTAQLCKRRSAHEHRFRQICEEYLKEIGLVCI